MDAVESESLERDATKGTMEKENIHAKPIAGEVNSV
jgi:hypothetical protein